MNTQAIINKVMEKNGIHEDQISQLVFQFFFEGTPTAIILKDFMNTHMEIPDLLFPLLRTLDSQFTYYTKECIDDDDLVYWDLLEINNKKCDLYDEFIQIEVDYECEYGDNICDNQLDADEKFIDKRKWMKKKNV